MKACWPSSMPAGKPAGSLDCTARPKPSTSVSCPSPHRPPVPNRPQKKQPDHRLNASSSLGEDVTTHYTLLSWKNGNSRWLFSLKRGSELSADIRRRGGAIAGAEALITQLGMLPRGTYVNWNKLRAIGFDYPPTSTIERIQAAARQRGLYLYFNFEMEE